MPDPGLLAPHELLVNLPQLITAYYTQPPAEPVAFGTSGHRGTALNGSFNELHVLAMSQAIAEIRKATCSGPLFLGKDTHGLSEPAEASAIEVLAAHGVEVVIAASGGYTPTPVISHAILGHNRNRRDRIADGIVITPSHNPPEDGGFKYNPPHGGPAEEALTKKIEARANELMSKPDQIERLPHAKARAMITERDFVTPYVEDLGSVIDMEVIAKARPKIGVDPMGGSGLAYWEPIAERYRLDLEVVNRRIDATFSFMTLDKDGKIRMDCSSPYAMASLIGLRDRFDVAFGNDTDFDRHGIVTRSAGLMNPNHYLAVAIEYLFSRRGWPERAAIGKTLVSSSMIDRVAKSLGRVLSEVPVGFKWFVAGLLDGSYGFGGEESAGASFLRRDGTVWTTDKDGFILDLLAAEMLSVTGRDPGELYRSLTERFGEPVYERIDEPATPAQKAALKNLTPDSVSASQLAGEPILAKLTTAPGNGAPIGGLKVVAENGWFAARPSGTENVYKIYTESFLGRDHLARIQEEARTIVSRAFDAAGR